VPGQCKALGRTRENRFGHGAERIEQAMIGNRYVSYIRERSCLRLPHRVIAEKSRDQNQRQFHTVRWTSTRVRSHNSARPNEI
jgi:hypothetical protein